MRGQSTDHVSIGDRVELPWGFDEVEGVVEEIYGPPARRHVVVRIPVYDASGAVIDAERVSVPLASVRPALTPA